jgi:small subunit ribosomal protein S18
MEVKMKPRGRKGSSVRRPARGGAPGASRRVYRGRKVCRFCKNPGIKIDYKDAKALRPFISERGKIVPRRISGNCARHQREVCVAINRARNLAILPFTATSLYI